MPPFIGKHDYTRNTFMGTARPQVRQHVRRQVPELVHGRGGGDRQAFCNDKEDCLVSALELILLHLPIQALAVNLEQARGFVFVAVSPTQGRQDESPFHSG